MRSYLIHSLEAEQEKVIVHGPSDYLALVDLESYKPFVGKETDHLDLMAHLQRETGALTITAWSVPRRLLNLRLVLTGDYLAMERMIETRQEVFASGWVRTHQGQLCLTSHERLNDCAHDRRHDLLRGDRLPDDSRPHLLNVPPGTYSIHIFNHPPSQTEMWGGDSARPKVHATILLRHYAFPAPRVAPTRLSGGLIPWAGEIAASEPWGGQHAA